MVMLATDHDRRVHPRFESRVNLTISTGLRRVPGYTVDVSVGGALIHWSDTLEQIEDALSTGHFVDIEFDRQVAVQGMVVRIDEKHLGVRFDIADDELPIILRKMSALTGCELAAA